jgi:hypothetical protein
MVAPDMALVFGRDLGVSDGTRPERWNDRPAVGAREHHEGREREWETPREELIACRFGFPH